MPPEAVQFIDILARGGMMAALAFALYGGWKQWYVWQHQYEELNRQWQQRYDEMTDTWRKRLEDEQTSHSETRQQRDHYLSLALSATRAAEVHAGLLPEKEP